MEKLNIDLGIKEYELCDGLTISFNPTDMELLNKIMECFQELQVEEETRRDRIAKITDYKEMYEEYAEMDRLFREKLNDLFGKDICTPLIGDINIYARGNGLPIWANIIIAIIDEFDDSIKEQDKIGKARIDKYTKKYHR